MPKKKLKYIFNICVLLMSVYFLYRSVDFTLVVKGLSSVNPLIYIATVMLSLVRNWLCGIRWELLHPVRSERLSRWFYFRLSMLSHLFNLIMPGALGGDIVKTVYAVGERTSNRLNDVIAVFVDRSIGLLSILLFGIFALTVMRVQLEIDFVYLLLLFVVSGGGALVFLNIQIVDWVERLLCKIKPLERIVTSGFEAWKNALGFYRVNLKLVFGSLALCIPIHLISFTIYYILSVHLGYNIDFLSIVFSVAIMWLITALPISVGGMGVRELSFVWLLGMFNIPSEQAVTLSLLAYINTLLISFISLPLLLDVKKKLDREEVANE